MICSVRKEWELGYAGEGRADCWLEQVAGLRSELQMAGNIFSTEDIKSLKTKFIPVRL